MDDNKPGLLLLSIIFLLSSVSCVSENENKQNQDAAMLYKESIELGRSYIDSINLAIDTATVNRLMDDYVEKIDKLNFRYPADVDLEMTEGQNDTLAIISARLVNLRKERIKKLCRESFPSDSI